MKRLTPIDRAVCQFPKQVDCQLSIRLESPGGNVRYSALEPKDAVCDCGFAYRMVQGDL